MCMCVCVCVCEGSGLMSGISQGSAVSRRGGAKGVIDSFHTDMLCMFFLCLCVAENNKQVQLNKKKEITKYI